MRNNLNELIRELEMPDVFDSLPIIPYCELITTKSGLYVTQESSDYFSGTAAHRFHNDQNVFDLQIVQKNQFLNGQPHGVSLKYDDAGEFIYARRYEHGTLAHEILNVQFLRLTQEGFLEAWSYTPLETYNTCYMTSTAKRYRFCGEGVLLDTHLKYKNRLKGITSVSNGLKSGNERIFHPNGTLKISRNYRNNILYGLYECFSENGKLLYEGDYINKVLPWEDVFPPESYEFNVLFNEFNVLFSKALMT